MTRKKAPCNFTSERAICSDPCASAASLQSCLISVALSCTASAAMPMSCGDEALGELGRALVRRGISVNSLFLEATGECDCFRSLRSRMTCCLTRRASSGVSRPDPADDSSESLGRSTPPEEDALENCVGIGGVHQALGRRTAAA